MPRNIKTPAKPKPEPIWEDNGLTAVEQSQALHLVVQLHADRKIEAPVAGATIPNKRNLARVITGMNLIDVKWSRFKNTETVHKCKKYTALARLVYDKIRGLSKRQEADETP